jgi:organic radical activating enzyme
MDSTQVFDKRESLRALSGFEISSDGVLDRIRFMRSRLPSAALDGHRRDIIGRACRALLGEAAAGEPAFSLRPHVISEMMRIGQQDLPRYLFYRYRYDVFPVTHELDAFPPCVQIEPTSICNYRCVFCYQTDRSFTQGRHGHMGQMSLDTFRRVVDQIDGEVEAVTLASRGEPLMCKGIEDMLAYLGGKFLGLKINTNAWYLDERKAHAILAAEPNTLVFSADAADAALYAKLRVNGTLERVHRNVRRFAEIKAKHYPTSRTITRVSGVRFSEEQDLAATERLWRDCVDQVAFVDYNPWENAYEQAPNGLTTPCSDLWRRAFVWWDGKINPCDVDYKSALSAGTIDTASLSQAWRGEAYEGLRRTHLANLRQSKSPCRGCALI